MSLAKARYDATVVYIYMYGRHGLYFFATYLYASEIVRDCSQTPLRILFRKRGIVLIILRSNLDSI